MMKDDELWLKKIKERLDDYSEPLPDTGWERLEKVLPASAPMSVGKKKQIMFRRWAMTAAAVVLVAVSSVSLWLLQSPVVERCVVQLNRLWQRYLMYCRNRQSRILKENSRNLLSGE